MSSRELERVEVMGRVASGGLKLVHAAEMLELSYRQTKRLWRRYWKKGREGLKHGHAGQASNRGKSKKLRRRVLQLSRKSIPEQKPRDSGRRWRQNTWPRKMGLSSTTKRCDAGCWPKVMEPAAKVQKALPAQRTESSFW